jgi:hypothetical protein
MDLDNREAGQAFLVELDDEELIHVTGGGGPTVAGLVATFEQTLKDHNIILP